MSKKNNFSRQNPASNEIKGYSDPVLATGKETFVYFYAFDPVSGQRKRKKYMLDHCRSKSEMKRTARDIIKNLTRKLEGGWNPWVENSDALGYTLFEKVADLYHDFLYKRLNDRSLREDTVI